jgi:hypothetical protein
VNVQYGELFRDCRTYLIGRAPVSTNEITASIKQYFYDKYSSAYTVLFTRDYQKEFVLDLVVTNFDPRQKMQGEMRQPAINSAKIYLAVESELGGTGGSSPSGVMNNVIEDFFKLTFINADYRILFFTSLPYADESDHVLNRAETLRQLYSIGPMNSHGICLFHLLGAQPRPGQVQVSISRSNIRGFIISADGLTCAEIATDQG